MDPKKLADLRTRVAARLEEIRRDRALHPPHRPHVNYEEVAAIAAWLDEMHNEPDEWLP